MKAAACFLGLILSAALLHGADVGELLTPDTVAGEWKPLISVLAAKGGVQASFTERRYFPFRHDPTILTGTLRISPERGLSLQYEHPEANILIADSSGILLRDAAGHDSALPSDSHQAAAISSLLPIMRFDLVALFPLFNIRAQRTGPDWRFEFSPKDPAATSALGLITVVGTDQEVRHLEFKHSEHQRIEIEVESPHSGVVFTPAEQRSFFR